MCYRWISTPFGTLPLSDSASCQVGTHIGFPTPRLLGHSRAPDPQRGLNQWLESTSSHRLHSCQEALWLWIDSSDEAAVVLSHPDSPFSGGHERGAVPDQNG